jgi:hypothetical protein
MLTALGTWFRHRRAPRVKPPGDRPPGPADAASAATVEAIQARVARWFARELPAQVALAQASVPALVAARPRLTDETVPNPTPLAWLTAALDVLEAWPEPLPVPCRAPALAWRYLVFLRTACDALEAAYGQVWQQGWSTHCPLTEVPDTHFAPRPLRPPRDRLPPSSEGLGALVLGSRLPEAGQQCLYEALAAGVDWVHPAAFWRELGIAPVASDPDPIRRDAPGPGATHSTVRQEPVPPAVVPAPAMAMAMAMAPPAEATPAVTGSMDDPLAAMARATLAAWIAHPRFNRHSGEGWWTGELYVAAKPFAEALQAHDEVVAQPESRNRKWLYRVLDERDLIVTNGGQRIWPLFVTGPGEPLPRFVSALKLAPALYAGLELGPVFQGIIEPARAERKPAVIDKAESASLQSQ